MKNLILITYFVFLFSTVACSQEKQTTSPYNTKMCAMSETYIKYDNEQKYYLKGSDIPFSGFLYASYDNGQLESVQQFVDGIGNGIWIDYAPDGKKVCQGTLIDNRVEGPVTFFYEDGSIKSKGKYLDWKRPIGLWTFYDRKGNIVSTRRYTR